MSIVRDNLKKISTGTKLGLGLRYEDPATRVMGSAKGEFIFTMTDAKSGEIQEHWQRRQVVTLDASLLVARLCKNNKEPKHGFNMLAVGTGALGSLLNPDAPTNQQRRLNNEIARKPFADATFRDANGAAVSIPTNVVDFTTIFGESEAVGPLNEMGILSTISDNTAIINNNPNFAGQGGQPYDPTIDITGYDTLCNFLTFSVISKPATSILTVTWRISY
jgi:hypothetical protein